MGRYLKQVAAFFVSIAGLLNRLVRDHGRVGWSGNVLTTRRCCHRDLLVRKRLGREIGLLGLVHGIVICFARSACIDHRLTEGGEIVGRFEFTVRRSKFVTRRFASVDGLLQCWRRCYVRLDLRLRLLLRGRCKAVSVRDNQCDKPCESQNCDDAFLDIVHVNPAKFVEGRK